MSQVVKQKARSRVYRNALQFVESLARSSETLGFALEIIYRVERKRNESKRLARCDGAGGLEATVPFW